MKKLALIPALAVLLILALTACGNNNGENDIAAYDPPQLSTPTPALDDATQEDPAPATPAIDLGGRVITSFSWWDIHRGRGTGSEPPDPAVAVNYLTERMQWDNLRRIEEEYNVAFDYTLISQGELSAILLATVMAGDSVGDVVYFLGGQSFSAAHGDLLHSLASFAPAGSDIFTSQNFVRPRNVLNGEYWNFSDTSPMVHGMGMGVNLDIINAIGAPNPVDLWERGEWTWDAMRDIMVMATMDTTGDGIIDQFGISGQPNNIFINLIAANDGHMVCPETFTYGFDHPNTVEALEFVYEIFNTLNVWFYDQGGSPMGDWGRNTFSYREGRSALFNAATWMLQDDDLPFEYAIVPYPIGPSGQGGYVRMYGFSSGFGIPVTVQNPDDVFLIMEQTMRWAQDEPELIVASILDYARPAWLTDADVFRAMHVGDNVKVDLGMVIHGYYWVLGTWAYYFHAGHMTVSQVVETFRPQQQEMIDLVFR